MIQHDRPCFSKSFTTDVFTVPFKEGHIVYIPRDGVVIGVDDRVKKLVDEISDGNSVQMTDFNQNWVNALGQLGVFDIQDRGADALLEKFLPTSITLSLTTRCSLRCIYCYARGGERFFDMDEDIVGSALALVIMNAKQKGDKRFRVSFHGQGEPTANWRLFRETVIRAQDLANRHDLGLDFSMSTNAIWGQEQREFVAQHFNNISVSLDGPPEIQNRQRPLANGGPSFQIVHDSMKYLQQAGIEYGVRSTVLPDSVQQMVDFVEFCGESLTGHTIQFEPVFLTGRALDVVSISDQQEFYDSFVREFERAYLTGNQLDIQVSYSGCRGEHYSGHFCNATGPSPNVLVTTDGIVSSCYEVVDPHSTKGKFSIYGHYDRNSRTFIFDENRLNQIRRFSVRDMTHCKTCFARWNCAGDCFARADISLDSRGNVIASSYSPRCIANRKTTRNDLVRRALSADSRDRSNVQPTTNCGKGKEGD